MGMVSDQWDAAAGVICPKCGEEALQIVGGICLKCHKAKKGQTEDKLEDKAERKFYQGELRKGTISLRQLREADPDS